MRLGMIGTRFAGLDGVSLESAKVAAALVAAGHEITWFAGELGPEFRPGTELPIAHFSTSENLALERMAFGGGDPDDVRRLIADRAAPIADALDAFVTEFDIDALIVQNAWSIPMQFPLAAAIDDIARRRDVPAIGHHHDFAWERDRFAHCVVPGVIDRLFPPVGAGVAHIVINSVARDELAERRSVNARVLPNVMDFGDPPPDGDGDAFRHKAGIGSGEHLLLQPTRVIPRKGIELTIELAARLAQPPHVVVTHPDDADSSYWGKLVEMAKPAGVDLRLVDAGRSSADLADAYAAADLVCFPSIREGFGNALIEAFYFRRPVLVNRYLVYRTDISPLGVDCIEIDGAVDEGAVARVEEVLTAPASAHEAIDRNAAVGAEHFSYDTARQVYESTLADLG